MLRAVIDIGSNTVKLLVADVRPDAIVPVLARDRTTRLGAGGGGSGLLAPEAMERTVLAVQEYLADARGLGAGAVRALATSAVREAANREVLARMLRDRCGLEVEVIDGRREAELVYRGVASDPAWRGRPVLVADVGGGSVEIILGINDRIEKHQSLPLGAVRLTEQFGQEDFAGLCAFLRERLSAALDGCPAGGRQMIGTGGTIVTLAAIQVRERPRSHRAGPLPSGPTEVDHVVLFQDRLREVVARLHAMPLAERRRVPGLPPDRADIMVAGGLVFVVVMEILGLSDLAVSVRNLRYGALVE